MNAVEPRLDRIRSRVAAKSHNARTIAALAGSAGQSQFAGARGNAFEAQVKVGSCVELLRLLREHLDLPIPKCPTTTSMMSGQLARRRLLGASRRLTPRGSGTATEVVLMHRVLGRTLPTHQPQCSRCLNLRLPACHQRADQNQPAKCKVTATTHTKMVILNHSRQVQRPTHSSSSGQPGGLGRSSSLLGMRAIY